MNGSSGPGHSPLRKKPLPDGSDDWPTADELCETYGISRRAFDAMGIPRVKVGRAYRYDPAVVANIKWDETPASYPDAGTPEGGYYTAQAPISNVLDAPTAALLKQAYAHNEFLFTRVLEALAEANKELRVRCSDLEQSHASLIAAREDALSEAAERQALAQVTAATEARKDRTLSEITELGKVALNNRANEKAGSAFLGSITDSQLDMALAFGDEFWSPEQLDLLKRIKVKRAPKDLSDPQTNGVST